MAVWSQIYISKILADFNLAVGWLIHQTAKSLIHAKYSEYTSSCVHVFHFAVGINMSIFTVFCACLCLHKILYTHRCN